MKTKQILQTTLMIIASVFYGEYASSQDFTATEIFDGIFKVESLQDGEDGEEQIVIASEKGVVVLNSFSSELAAQDWQTSGKTLYLVERTTRWMRHSMRRWRKPCRVMLCCCPLAVPVKTCSAIMPREAESSAVW